MKNIVLNLDNGLINPPVGSTHIGTSWQVSTVNAFTSNRFIIHESMNDTVNKLSLTIPLNVVDDADFYYRFKLHYSNGQSSSWSEPTYQSMVIDGFTKPIVIKTPIVNVKMDYSKAIPGELVIETSDFKSYGREATHDSTSYVITDDLTNEVVNIDKDINNLTGLVLPLSTINDDRIYKINVKHNSGISSSDASVTHLSTFIENGKYVDMNLIGKLYAYAELYFNVIVKTTRFKKIIIRIIDPITNEIVLPDTEEQSLNPKIETLYLDLEKDYKIEACVRLTDNSRSPWQEIFVGKPSVLALYSINPTFKYLDGYTYVDNYTTNGITVQSVRQLLDGTILLAKQGDSNVYRYTFENNKLVDGGVAFNLGDTIGIQYINIQQLYNGKVVVNYSSNTNSLTKQRSVFKVYNYNTGTKIFTLANSITMDNQWLSTAVSNSMFINKDSSVYYIPGNEVVDGVTVNLSLYKLNTETFENVKVMDLPFVADKHVSIATVSDTKFLVFGGTTGSSIVNNEKTWYRSNNEIYLYDTVQGTMTLQATLDNLDVADTIYNFQSYLRKDGKIAIFNSVRNGLSTGNQSVIVYDVAKKSYTVTNVDYSDNLLYRSGISLLNGDILRMTALPSDSQYVYSYVGDSITKEQMIEHIGTVEEPNELIVSEGETLTIENLEYYTKVTILGTSDVNTGRIVREFDGKTETYNWKYLIITRDTVMDRTSYEALAPEQVVIIGNVNFTIEDY